MPELIPVSADDGTPVPEAPMTVYETKITHDESTTHTALDDGAPRGLVGLRCRFRGSRAPATVSRVKRSLSFSGGHHAEPPHHYFIRRELPGWPKDLPCLNCGCVRRSEDPGDRLCDTCRGRAADIDTGPPHHAPGLQ